MAVIGLPPSSGQGPFWSVAWSVGTVSEWFGNVSEDIANVPILGNRLSYPFYAVSYYLRHAADRLRTADDSYVRVRDRLNYLFDGSGFLGLLYWASGNFRTIRENPGQFVLNSLYAISGELWSFAVNPIGFINARIRGISSYLSWFISDPMGLFVAFLRSINWWIGWFIDNPSDWLRSFLRGVSWQIGMLVDNPLGFVNHFVRSLSSQLGYIIDDARGWFVGKLWEVSPNLYHLALNTSYFLKSQIAGYLGFDMGFWSNPIDYLTRRMLERLRFMLGFYANTIKELVIDLILLFI